MLHQKTRSNLGDFENRNTFTKVDGLDNVTAVSAGDHHTIIKKVDGTLWATGKNNGYQFGLGTAFDKTHTFQKISTIPDVKSIVCGRHNSFILKTDGTLLVAGDNFTGNSGFPQSETHLKEFTEVLKDVTSVSTSSIKSSHSIALKKDGTLWSTGDNSQGQLGVKDKVNRYKFTQVVGINDVTNINAGCNTTILTNTNLETSLIYNNELVNLLKGIPVKDMCAWDHALILSQNGSLYVCGNNGKGELGLGNNETQDIFVKNNIIDNVKKIACGWEYSIILKNDGTLWVTGNNMYGQLGLGSVEKVHEFTQIKQ